MAELWKNRFGGGSRDTVGRRFEGHGLAEVYRDSLAKVRERQLGEGSRETAWSRSAYLDVKRKGTSMVTKAGTRYGGRKMVEYAYD